jgi:hypothetical protein
MVQVTWTWSEWIVDPTNFKIKINEVFDITNEWFATNFLTINYEKPYFLQFQTKNIKLLDIQVSYWNNQISGNTKVSFLGVKSYNFLTWKDYIDVLIDKLNRSCFAIRSVKSILSLETIKIVYYSYVHSILNHGIIFWGNSSYSVKVFRIQKGNSELWWIQQGEPRFVVYLENWLSSRNKHSIFYQFLCLL